MPWGIAASDESASIKWYRSTAPNEDGTPSTIGDLNERIWDNYEPEGISSSAVNEHKKKAMETLGAKTPEQLGSWFSVKQ